METPIYRKLFQHGGSKAIDLPMEFVRRLNKDTVSIELRKEGLFIPVEPSMDSMEADPLFQTFIAALYYNALKTPEQLRDIHDVWDGEWADLLEGVDDRE